MPLLFIPLVLSSLSAEAGSYNLEVVRSGQIYEAPWSCDSLGDGLLFEDAFVAEFNTSSATVDQLTAMQAAAEAGTLQLQIDPYIVLQNQAWEVRVCTDTRMRLRDANGRLQLRDPATGAQPALEPYVRLCIQPGEPNWERTALETYTVDPRADIASLRLLYHARGRIECLIDDPVHAGHLRNTVDHPLFNVPWRLTWP